MEAAWVVAGVVLGALLTLVVIGTAERRRARRRALDDRRLLYARTLATYDSAYRLVDFFIGWPRRDRGNGGSSSKSERSSARSGAVLSEASAELETVVRRGRELAAELRIAGSTEIVPLAVALHDALEEAVLALKLDTPAKLERRWSVVAPNWRSAREAFAQAAREELDV